MAGQEVITEEEDMRLLELQRAQASPSDVRLSYDLVNKARRNVSCACWAGGSNQTAVSLCTARVVAHFHACTPDHHQRGGVHACCTCTWPLLVF